MPPRLCVIGLSHRTAPVEIREQMAFDGDALELALKAALEQAGVREAMILSTCNRVELYTGIEAANPLELKRFFLAARQLHEAGVEEQLYTLEGEEALRHLYRVAASLDSLVVGEPQILGQVKDAFARAGAAGTVGPVLNRTMPRAFQVAKRVRTETEVAKSASSVASAAVDLASQIFGNLAGRSVLVIGAGEMGELAARHLQTAGISQLHVVSRTFERAAKLAADLGGQAAPIEQMDALMAQVDIVLCSTGARAPVVKADRVQRVMKQRRGRWLFFIDIAVPRDVEAEVGSLENVYLYDVDALEQVVATGRAARAKAAEEAEALVDEEVRRAARDERAQGAVPTIKALRERFLAVARAEVERNLPRLQLAGDRERAAVVALAEAVVNKLLHTPMTVLKREAAGEDGDALAAAIQRLFELETAGEADAGAPAPEQVEAGPRRAGSGEK